MLLPSTWQEDYKPKQTTKIRTLHLLGRAVSLFASVIMENKVLKLNRIFYCPEFLCGKFMIESMISPGPYYQKV